MDAPDAVFRMGYSVLVPAGVQLGLAGVQAQAHG
jgi:hypothetical protein